MKRYKRKASKLLLVIFSTILLFSFFQSKVDSTNESNALAFVQAPEFFGEAPGNVSRTYFDVAGHEGRLHQDFSFHSIIEIHGTISRVILSQSKTTVEQFKAPVKVYKQVRKYLI